MSDSTAEAARREAEAYCDRVAPSISWSYTHRRAIEAAFTAGWEACNTQVQVTDDMVEAACEAYKGPLMDEELEEWQRVRIIQCVPYRMRAAIAAALEKRERL
jgi:hypothetical protein